MHPRCLYRDEEVGRIEESLNRCFAGYLRDENDVLMPIFLTPEHMANRREIILKLNGLDVPNALQADENASNGSAQQKPRRGRPSIKLPEKDVAALARQGLGARSIAKELAKQGVKVSASTIERYLAEWRVEAA